MTSSKGSKSESDMVMVLASMITKPKPMGSIPTLVSFKENEDTPERFVLLDIPESYLGEAWAYYKDNSRNPDVSSFLMMVYDIMKMGIPRLYRAVSKLSLD